MLLPAIGGKGFCHSPFDGRRTGYRCVRPSTRGVPRIVVTMKVQILARDGCPARRVASPPIASRHGRDPRRRTRSGVDSFAALLLSRRRPGAVESPYPRPPRAHVPDPRHPVALHPFMPTFSILVAPSHHLHIPAPPLHPCLCSGTPCVPTHLSGC